MVVVNVVGAGPALGLSDSISRLGPSPGFFGALLGYTTGVSAQTANDRGQRQAIVDKRGYSSTANLSMRCVELWVNA